MKRGDVVQVVSMHAGELNGLVGVLASDASRGLAGVAFLTWERGRYAFYPEQVRLIETKTGGLQR